MASKSRNANERTTTDGLDKQDPLDFETLNSEPKQGKSKSESTRIRDRQEREKLLQQHRLHQQEILRRQRERNENAETTAVHLTAENQQPDHHTESDQRLAEDSTVEKALRDLPRESQQPGTEPDVHPVVKPAVDDHESAVHNDEGDGALGDSISQNVGSDLQRCTNCCGRPQFPDPRGTRHDEFSEIFEPNEGISGRIGADQCGAELGNGGRTSSSNSCVSDVTVHDEQTTSQNFKMENETRLRGGCGGGCGGGGGGARNSACCPCGGCGGAVCATSATRDGGSPSGCCGGNQSRGLPCRCKCRSCSSPVPPCGTCGGQNCGKWNSCAGNGGGGKCCFPRNTRRHNGADCCGGGNGSGSGCGGCC